jgi:hypothetical protein
MATNKLMEAAADILTQSKKNAPSEPMHKMATTIDDVGGPTPENYKPDDDSAKMDTTKGVRDGAAASNAASIKMKPSKASPDTQMHSGNGTKEMKEEKHDDEEDEDDEDDEKEMKKKKMSESMHSKGMHRMPDGTMMKNSDMKKKMKEDIDSLFSDDSTISEEFKEKAFTIFEARVFDRVTQIEEEIETKYASMLEEAIDQIKSDLTTKVDDYLNYVVEQWLADNEIAIESGLRAELTEEFIVGLRNLFAEHYIDVPTEKVDLVDELATKVEELESKLNEEIERGISYAKALVESRKNELTREVTDGLTTTQAEKIKSLAEGVEFSTEEEYTDKLETIRENYFPSGVKKAEEKQLHEQVEEANEQKAINDPFVALVSKAISKTKV